MKKGFTPTPKIKSRREFLVWGFTLVEVVVVIGIIAILTVIIFPAINKIRAKNRDAERISDIAVIQLGLSLYYNQHPNIGYPADLQVLVPVYVPEDSTTPPASGDPDYLYVPLRKKNSGDKCTFYHLGIHLELPSAQIDSGNIFNSTSAGLGNYEYCPGYSGGGFNGYSSVNPLIYQVHP